MKIFWISFLLVLSGCTIGNGHICGPQTPAAYCDKDAYEKLMHPKPYGAHWVKEGMTREDQLNDWVRCGGDRSGSFSPSLKTLSDGEKVGISREQTRTRLEADADSCMVNRGYRFIRD